MFSVYYLDSNFSQVCGCVALQSKEIPSVLLIASSGCDLYMYETGKHERFAAY